jgi:succinate-semialdehyde dehydrogenase/glutarate-semialdehyde dehydrogenase
MPHSVPKLNDQSLFKTDVAYVNGEWVKAASGKTFEVFGTSAEAQVVHPSILIF